MAKMLMDEPTIRVEVAYARAHEQKIIALKVKEGTTVLDAAKESGIVDYFPEIVMDDAKLGIFGKAVLKPGDQVLREGERVEIYRPLIADPKEVRKRRAEQMKQKKSGQGNE
ncbi:RnfH family protein [Endozoicomonas sp. SCSIO W0465]|uniref:RnfH family protein n=1 Tax=Endozoicomonas sp. SCSIO W0465 TaxID=2918516 RepID=UPI0020764C10|nr:RnfH family protein [Endozoicomonas sp. SCSIO W0465]USE37926.1 RnfH family protein [Endozoicomonas sp. SCSIO W0465]